MAVAVETIRRKNEGLTSVDRLLEFATRLYQTLGIEPDSPIKGIKTLFPQELFEHPTNMLPKSMELAQKVSVAWQPPNSNHHFRPDNDLAVRGLVDFGVYAVQILTESLPNTPVEDIEEGILQVITRIRSAIETSDGRHHNLRTDRDRLRNSFTEELTRSSKTNL